MKTKQADSKIVASLEALKTELLEREANSSTVREILFKINSCLYSQYPAAKA